MNGVHMISDYETTHMQRALQSRVKTTRTWHTTRISLG